MAIRNIFASEPTYPALFHGWTQSIQDESDNTDPLKQLNHLEGINTQSLTSYYPNGFGSPLYRLTTKNASALTMAEIMDLLITGAENPSARLAGKLSITTADVTFEHPDQTGLHLNNQNDINKLLKNYRYTLDCRFPIPDDYFRTHSGIYLPASVKDDEAPGYSILGSNIEHPTRTDFTRTEKTLSLLDSPTYIALAGNSKERLDNFCFALTRLTEAPPHRIFWSKPLNNTPVYQPTGSFWKLDITRYVEKDRKQPDYWAHVSLSQCKAKEKDKQRFIAYSESNQA